MTRRSARSSASCPGSGRSSSINVQNIPKRDTVIKAAFCPKLDAFVACDYPNIEAKFLAYFLEALDFPEMAEAFRNGMDLHTVTAAGVYGCTPEEVEPLQRDVGKRLNFSIIYGGGTRTLISQGVAKDFKDAMALLRRYHEAWPGIGWESKRQQANEGTFIWWIKKRMRERGYITTPWGRHLHPQEMHAALNHLCQGSAADLMKWALIRVHNYLRENGMEAHLVNVVHDELMIDAPASEVDHLARVVPDLMTYGPLNDVVPIRPEPEVSYDTWATKEPYLLTDVS